MSHFEREAAPHSEDGRFTPAQQLKEAAKKSAHFTYKYRALISLGIVSAVVAFAIACGDDKEVPIETVPLTLTPVENPAATVVPIVAVAESLSCGAHIDDVVSGNLVENKLTVLFEGQSIQTETLSFMQENSLCFEPPFVVDSNNPWFSVVLDANSPERETVIDELDDLPGVVQVDEVHTSGI